MSDSASSPAQTYSFTTVPSQERRLFISSLTRESGYAGIPVVPLYFGVAAIRVDHKTARIGIAIHDGVYAVDACIIQSIASDGQCIQELVRRDIIETIRYYSTEQEAKFVGAGVTVGLENIYPGICASLWSHLDVVAISVSVETTALGAFEDTGTIPVDVDEQAYSAARKCVMRFGPNHTPALAITFRNQVMPDAQGAIKLVRGFRDYEYTVHKGTWNTVLEYAHELKGYRNGQTVGDPQCPPTKIAFFSATPQGGGVAMMRHALVRFCDQLGVKLNWYIPKPNPKAFRITKTNHNILQGVADPGERFGEEKQALLNQWIATNAERYWLTPGGPLAPGGADVVIIDDHQMPALIPIIKKHRPEIKIIYRSHIEIRSDLVDRPGSPQEQVWKWIWNFVKQADIFISHPVAKFVPHEVPLEMVGLMPASTEWLDGLNQILSWRDVRFYHRQLGNSCNDLGMNKLLFPARDYIVQIARFDPSKGIPDVIESYRKLCARIANQTPNLRTPQLLLCGHGAIDDPDASIVFAETMELLEQSRYSAIAKDVVVMRIGPNDQMLNALTSTARVVVQLSLREGFEVKVSEALRRRKPVIATRAGGIPLQIQHGKSGFLVEVGDTEAVANHLFDLYTDNRLYDEMSEYAAESVSDEVGTVGNAACWLYLAAKLARGQALKPNGGWITDMAREEAGQPYEPDETILPRGESILRAKAKSV